MLKKMDIKYADFVGTYSHYGRDSFYDFFLEQLKNHLGGLNIALSGSWGSGKTFLVNSMMVDISKIDSIEGIYFNVWENEYFETPLYGLLNTLLKNQEFDAVFKNVVMKDTQYEINTSFSINYLALSVGVSLQKENKIEELLKDISFSNVAIELLGTLIEKYLVNKNRLIIFVDELDRCKPNYAVKVLEQFNHLFNNKLTIVYSVDSEQLNASIKHVYGAEYNAKIYLYKFFDDIISVPKLDHDNVFKYMINQDSTIKGINFVSDIVYECIVYYDINFREINRFIKYPSIIKRLGYLRTSHVSERLFYTLLIIFCLIKVKDKTLISNVILDSNYFTQLGKELNNINSLIDTVIKESEANPVFTSDLKHIIRTILDEPEIRTILL